MPSLVKFKVNIITDAPVLVAREINRRIKQVATGLGDTKVYPATAICYLTDEHGNVIDPDLAVWTTDLPDGGNYIPL